MGRGNVVTSNVSGYAVGVEAAPDVVYQPIESIPWGVTGMWRPAGMLDWWRLRGAPIVARTSVRSDDELRLGSVIVLTTAGNNPSDMWLRVLGCTRLESGYAISLGVLGEP